MDILVSSTYLICMMSRLITMLAMLAIIVVTTVTSAHAARMSMSSVSDHPTHVGETMQAPHYSEPSCDGERHCGSADAEICEFVCAGLSAFLSSPGGEAGYHFESTIHDSRSEPSHVSRSPGLNEHPPKLRLL